MGNRVHSPAGTLLQDSKGSSKEAAQLASAKLNTTLFILLGLCAFDVHVARLVFALLGKVCGISPVLPCCFSLDFTSCDELASNTQLGMYAAQRQYSGLT